MRNFKVVKIIAIVLGFVLATVGCGTEKNQAANENFGLTAEASPEGLLLTFSNVPPDAIRLWISVCDIETEDPENITFSYADIRDSSFPSKAVYSAQLEKVKQTGKVVFPIVQPGKKYHISATFYTMHDHDLFMDENVTPFTASVECIAENGIYFDRNLKLELNETNSSATLSSEPVFSSDVIFDVQKYGFAVTINAEEEPVSSIGAGDHQIPTINGLTWTFDPQFTEAVRLFDYLEGNSYPAYVSAYSNITYDDITWSIQIAKTHFTYLYSK